MEKPEHIVRMESELADLDEKIVKADDFLHSADGVLMLNRTQVHLLHIQLDAMRSYRRVLAIRIEHDTDLAEHVRLERAQEILGDAVATES